MMNDIDSSRCASIASSARTRMRRHAALLCASVALAGASSAQIQSIDGSGNNLAHPDFGRTGTPLLRTTTNGYADGRSKPGGATRPSARVISNAVAAQSRSMPNERGASDWVWQWGQFIDHDLDLTLTATPEEPLDIAVPSGDPFFDPFHSGVQVIGMDRSACTLDAAGVRQQVNALTAWIDGSMVYGSDPARALELRTLAKGRMKTSAGNLLPFDPQNPAAFVAGDVRVNEQIGLTAVHTLFLREHNFWAARFAGLPLGDEAIYQLARRIVIAEIQSITFNEFLPTLLGPRTIASYSGYDARVDPAVANVFAAAVYRVGHTMLSETLLRLDENAQEIAAGHLSLADSFFNTGAILADGIDPILRGLARQTAQRVDTRIVDPVRNFLFGPPGAGGLDLASLNIQRGRDHGLPDYNQVRADYGLAPVRSFGHVTSDRALADALETTYRSVDDIDPWVGALAEDHLPGAMVGELVTAVLKDQFERARDGDRYWYQNALSPRVQRFIERQQLARIIRRNTRIGAELQPDAFHVPARGSRP